MKIAFTRRSLLLGLTGAALTLGAGIGPSGAPTLGSLAQAGAGGGDGEGMEHLFRDQVRLRRIQNFNRRQAARRAAIQARRAARANARRGARNARRAARAARRAARRAAARAARGARFARNPTWASSTDPRTGVTTTSRGLANGSRQVTVTNSQGVVIDNYVVN